MPSRPGKSAGFLERSSLIRRYLWKYRKWVAIGLFALVCVDIFEIIPPLLLKRAIDSIVAGSPYAELFRISGLFILVAVFQAIGRYGWRKFLIRASFEGGRDIRDAFGAHLFRMPASFYDKRRIGELMSLATNDVEAVRMAIGPGLLTLADALFYVLTVPIVMFMLSPKLALFALLPLPIIPFIVARKEREVHARFERVQDCFGRLASSSQENLNGVRINRAFAREDVRVAEFKRMGEEFVALNMSLARVQSTFGPTLDFTMSLGLVLLLYFGGASVIDGAVTLGTFVAFQRYIQKMVWPMTAVGLAITYYERAIASSDRLKEVQAVESDIPEPKNPRLPAHQLGAVEFRKLIFTYPGAQKPALTDINLKIEPGERIAFLGSIGSGKSALLGILPRVYPIDPGMAFLDGIDIRDYPLAELRARIGYVSQDIFLFSESVRENIALSLANPGGDVQSQIEEAARASMIHDEILKFSNGYQTQLGERGVNLSGGQKQRVTLARALIRKPAVLILDDALASVDTRTESLILAQLRDRGQRKTELLAAHRISTVQSADRIVVLENGKILQQGTHAKLIAERSGLYFRYYEQQRLKDELESYASSLEIIEQPREAT